MAKLVVLSEGMTGQSYELKVEKTTVGRVDDNTFPIAHASVSSHHCEILLRGNDVVVKDLNSTNGTFINNQQVTTESVLKPGQILRLGQIEVRLDAPGAAAPTAKRPVDSTMVIPKGVSLQQLEQAPGIPNTAKTGFTKKTDKSKAYLIGGLIAFALIILTVFIYALTTMGGGNH